MTKRPKDSFGIIKSEMDTLEVSIKDIKAWNRPPFQRPLRVNEKVRAIAERVKNDGGVLPGPLTLGVFEGKVYLIDGNHRREAGLLSGCDPLYADVRRLTFESMAAMGEEFVRLNSALVKFKPDDILRGMEGSLDSLQRIRKSCEFVGYDVTRRSEKAPMLSMSVALRCWCASGREVPMSSISATTIASEISHDEVTNLISFLILAMQAWGRDPEYLRLWSALNLTLCMWLFRRVVLGEMASAKSARLSTAQWKRCMSALSADEHYLEWLIGRGLGEKHRSPAYGKIKSIVGNRAGADVGKKLMLPSPAWAANSGRSAVRQ